MPVDYSKWDALELSDDSDIEVHPNVDKKSFIRAKQAQIHQNRAQRKHQIATLGYERIINDGLILRIDRLLTALKSHRANTDANPDQLVFQSLIESAGDPNDDSPPPPPAGVYVNVEGENRYSKMMAGLVDAVKTEMDEKKESGSRLELFIKGVEGHKTKVAGLQSDLQAKLAELEKEDKRMITSGDIHDGFDYSNVAKGQPISPASATAGAPSSSVELLNPGASSRPAPERMDTSQSAGADADIEDGPDPDDDDDEDIARASPAAKKFAQIPTGDYRSALAFLSSNPQILKEQESDGLLVEAFEAQEQGNPTYAKQCVHQALLIQYCRQLGKDGVALFFKRITTQGHQANKLFVDDVNSTYARIRDRVKVLAEQRASDPSSGDVEQIQLHAVDPNTTITITVPPPIPSEIDLSAPGAQPPPPEYAEVIAARKIFESFPPGLQRALESGSLAEVNKVLGKMSVEEAEEVVEKLSQGGMLNLEEGVLDATTDEGRAMVEEIERTGRLPGVGEGEEVMDVDDGDPPLG